MAGVRRDFLGGCECRLRIFKMVVALCLVWSPLSAWAQVRWQSGTSALSGKSRAQIVDTVVLATAPGADRHLVVQFNQPVTPALRAELRTMGVHLLSYLGDNAFFASVLPLAVDAKALAKVDSLIDAQTIRRDWKLHPDVLSDIVPEWAVVKPARAKNIFALPSAEDENTAGDTVVAIYILFHRDVDLDSEGRAAAQRHGAWIRSHMRSINGLVIELPLSNIDALADEDVTAWIEWPLPRLSQINDSNRVITEANIVQDPPYGLDGSGVIVQVYDAGHARETHVDFGGRLTTYDDTADNQSHATHVACTIGGDGTASGGSFRGMAPGCTLLSYGFEYDGGIFFYEDPGDIEADINDAMNVQGAVLFNASLGTNTEFNGFPCEIQGNYGAASAVIDAIVRGSLGAPFRIVWAGGNERGGSRCDVEGYGDYYSTAPPAGAKNHIAVGALNSNDDSMASFSSWGPVDDGRMKPDICAPGCQSGGDGGVTSCTGSSDTGYTTMCGTSMASPTVCGLSALVLEDVRAQFPGEPEIRNSTLKILFAHNAEDLGNTGPDYQFGYGSVRIQRTVDFLRAGNFLENEVDQDGTYSALVSVGPDDTELRVTLAWDDVPGTVNVDPALVNDLDLRVFDPSAQEHYPWSLDPLDPAAPAIRTQADHVNNIEQVLIDNPEPGVYVVEVHGYNVPDGPQPFSLAGSPKLVACASTGFISLDSPLYSCSAQAEIQVVDCDLNTDEGAVETVTVTIASDSEPAGETVLLTETDPESADFRGVIQFDVSDSPGVLQVAEGDTVTATYVDVDDGQGGQDVIVTAIATLDCTGPVISNMEIPEVGSEVARVTFDTDEPATGTVRYGSSCSEKTESVSEEEAETSHGLLLTGLDFDTQYYFSVEVVDNQGNAATDDNGGECYTFTTPNVLYYFHMDAEPGWLPRGQWAFGQPTGGGGEGAGGGPDPTSGHTGPNVYGYNLDGDYTDSIPELDLTSAAIDCTGLTNVRLAFWRWLGVDAPTDDHAYVRISNDDSTWVTVWENADVVADSSWQYQDLDISAIADNAAALQIRWTMGATNSSQTFCGWNVDDVQIIATVGPLPIEFPKGLPDRLPPGQLTDITVRIAEGAEEYIPDSATLYYRYYGGEFNSAPLVPLGGDLYLGTLPAPNCEAVPEFYFSAEGSESGVAYQPPTAPATPFTVQVGEVTTIFADDFEKDQSWTVENSPPLVDGQWERGIPVNCDRGDPPSDYDGSSNCYLTDNSSEDDCNSDVDEGSTWLITPTLDLSAGDAEIRYALWYTNYLDPNPNSDLFVVWVSNDNGATWAMVETFGPQTSSGWTEHAFMVADFVSPTAQVKVRFEASDLDAASIVEAGVDAFSVVEFSCVYTIGDLDGDGDVDLDDHALFAECLSGPGVTTPPDGCSLDEFARADIDADSDVDLVDAGAFFSGFTED